MVIFMERKGYIGTAGQVEGVKLYIYRYTIHEIGAWHGRADAT